ncbi:hypothetical protein P692DRAFT_20878983 [Suillus brevipes Sb2]|nr:hypothetical protein P692DRAFT_20878983 [Suillus brevipes Sb2]
MEIIPLVPTHLESKYRQHTPSSQTSFLRRLIRYRLLDEIEGDTNQHCIKPFSTPEVYRYHIGKVVKRAPNNVNPPRGILIA